MIHQNIVEETIAVVEGEQFFRLGNQFVGIGIVDAKPGPSCLKRTADTLAIFHELTPLRMPLSSRDIPDNRDIDGAANARAMASLNLFTEQIECERRMHGSDFCGIVVHAMVAFGENGN